MTKLLSNTLSSRITSESDAVVSKPGDSTGHTAATIKHPYQSSIYKTPLYLAKSPTDKPVLETAISQALSSQFVQAAKPAPAAEPMQARPLQVLGLNHFNITASPALIEQVRRFYLDVIGLTIGPRAHLDHEGYWLYAGEVPILHLSACRKVSSVTTTQKGYFNHISLSCVGLTAAIAKMLATGTPYRMIQLSDIHQTQLFLTDPAGIGVELTFFNESL